MRFPTEEEQRQWVQQWEAAGRDLERMRRERLRDLPYRWEDVTALLDLGTLSEAPSRTSSGLVEMQRWFMKMREQDESRGLQ